MGAGPAFLEHDPVIRMAVIKAAADHASQAHMGQCVRTGVPLISPILHG